MPERAGMYHESRSGPSAAVRFIPAAARAGHMQENMGALRGRLPDRAMYERMARHVESL